MGFNIKTSPDLSPFRLPLDTKRFSMITSRPDSITPLTAISKLSNIHASPLLSPKPPNCRSSLSPSPRPYIAFTTPRNKSSQDIAKEAEVDAKLEKFHNSMNKSRLDEVKLKKLMISKIQEWSSIKSLRNEELLFKNQVLKDKEKSRPNERHDYQSDNEDFTYSFTNRAGKIRKKKNKLIKVSKRPDYIGASGYISVQPHRPYTRHEIKREEKPAEILQEAMKIKRTLSKKGIPLSYKIIMSQISDQKQKNLPRGGELLLRV